MTGNTEDFDEMAAIGETLRWHRQDADLTQAELAEQVSSYGLPWHTSTVSKTESGRRELTVRELLALSEILGTSPAALLEVSPSVLPSRLSRIVAAQTARIRAERIEKRARETRRRITEIEDEIELEKDGVDYWQRHLAVYVDQAESLAQMAEKYRNLADNAEAAADKGEPE